MEMLEQVGLGSKIAQQCFACRTAVGYDSNGNEIKGRGWSFVEDIPDTTWNFATICRQKFVEEIYRKELEGLGVSVYSPVDFKDLTIDHSVPQGEHRVMATVLDVATDQDYQIKCRYLIGADGSRTAVRRAASIESDGDSTEDRWVRIDGVLDTDMPKARSYGAIESPIYGNVLWIPLDHNATRIGYHMSEARQNLYDGGFTQEIAVKEAKEAVKPFHIEYKQVDWASVYIVGQRVARHFFTQGCIFLAGDACHTHSSGAGQGMNAGTHDAVNLAWKLSLVLRGIAKPDLLDTYEHERRPNAQKLIDYDKDISVLISKRLPKSWTGDPGADPNVVLGQILQEAKGFNTGLTIGYERNVLNHDDQRGSGIKSLTPIHTMPSPATPGYRGPDVILATPATFESLRLYKLTPNNTRFYILLFAGEPSVTATFLSRFASALASSSLFSRPRLPPSNAQSSGDISYLSASTETSLPMDFITILATKGASVWEMMGNMPPLGSAYFDPDHSAHERYGIDVKEGSVVVLRPDGWIGMKIPVNADAVKKIEVYFSGFLNV